jgi:hypothetical protein
LNFEDENISVHDLAAIANRILYIPARQEAAGFLAKWNDENRMTRSWIEGDLLPRHLLWLKENRTIVPGKRFLVEGEETEIHKRLVTRGSHNDLVFEWLAGFASKPQKIQKLYVNAGETPMAQIGEGKILINTQAVEDHWDQYLFEDYKRITGKAIGSILTRVSEKVRRLTGNNGKRLRFNEIRADILLTWVKENQIGDEDEIEANLLKPLIGLKT